MINEILSVLSVIVLSTSADVPRVSIRVSSRQVMAGQAMRVQCRVPRDADNRLLEASLSNYQISQRPLEGEQAAVTHDFLFDHIPCVVDVASCAVRAVNHKDAIASVSIQVAGCEE